MEIDSSLEVMIELVKYGILTQEMSYFLWMVTKTLFTVWHLTIPLGNFSNFKILFKI